VSYHDENATVMSIVAEAVREGIEIT